MGFITENHYTSGDYWRTRLNSSSDFKVSLALRALASARIELKPGLTAVEVGCGNGAFLFPLRDALDVRLRSFQLCGLDISPLAVETARQRCRMDSDNRVSFRVGSAADIPAYFDIAFLMDVLEHVTDPYSFLASVRSNASLVILHIPIEQSLAHNVLHKAQQSYRVFHHIHFFSLETMKLMIKEAGFDILSMQFSAASPEILQLPGTIAVRLCRTLRYGLYKLSPYISSLFLGGSVMVIMKPAPVNQHATHVAADPIAATSSSPREFGRP